MPALSRAGTSSLRAGSPEALAALPTPWPRTSCAGFDLGVQVYDPLGLPFWFAGAMRNDGTGCERNATEEFAPPLDACCRTASPLYDVVNGVSELGAHAGEFVDVVNDWMTVVCPSWKAVT